MYKKVAILGSNGFLGSLIKDHLPPKYRRVGLHRKKCDLTNYQNLTDILKKNHFDVVINCASSAGGGKNLGTDNYDDFKNNILIHSNLINNNHLYGQLINIGSGAEYNIKENIENVSEEDVFTRIPTDSYGLSKNTISKLSKQKNICTLRLFGCFDPTESDYRFLKSFTNSIKNNETFILNKDRKYSWISALDFIDILDQCMSKEKEIPSQINCAYNEQLFLSEFLKKYCDIHKIDHNWKYQSFSGNNYTCSNKLMNQHFTIKYGLEKSLYDYK